MKHVVVGYDNASQVVAKEVESGVREFIVWKLGDRDRPAQAEDIADFVEILEKGLKNPDSDITHFVTHHAVYTERVQLQGCCPNQCCQNLAVASPDDVLELDAVVDDSLGNEVFDDGPTCDHQDCPKKSE